MKISDLSDKDLIQEFEKYSGLGSSDYMAFCREFYKRLKNRVENIENFKKSVSNIKSIFKDHVKKALEDQK